MEDPEILGELEERFIQPYQATKTYLCPGCNREIPPGLGPVSYTHLTLPTICSV